MANAADLKINDYAMSVIINMNDRISAYQEGGASVIGTTVADNDATGQYLINRMSELADVLMASLGVYYPVTLFRPLVTAVKASEWGKLTFDSTAVLVIAFLVILAGLLVLTLFVSSIADMVSQVMCTHHHTTDAILVDLRIWPAAFSWNETAWNDKSTYDTLLSSGSASQFDRPSTCSPHLHTDWVHTPGVYCTELLGLVGSNLHHMELMLGLT